MPDLTISADLLAAAVRALDTQAARAGIDPATAVDLQALKVVEELGEAVAALIGMTGQNPRKGVTHTRADLVSELYDVALTALVDTASVHYSMLDGGLGSLRVTYAVPPGEPQATLALALLVQASGQVGAALLAGNRADLSEALHYVAAIALEVAAGWASDVEAEFAAHVEKKVSRLVEAVHRG